MLQVFSDGPTDWPTDRLIESRARDKKTLWFHYFYRFQMNAKNKFCARLSVTPRSWGVRPLSLHSFRNCFLYENDELPFKHSHTHVWYFSSWTDHHNDQLNLRKKGKQFIFHDFFAFFWYFLAFFGFFFCRISENPSIALRYSCINFLHTWKRPIMAYRKKKASGTIFFTKMLL